MEFENILCNNIQSTSDKGVFYETVNGKTI